ncbi:hypothetical protein BDV29DRAFT_162829 [Aspergillus leporis]|uniref:Uncharacterized protein n=1 Tax=Aspergillus leporis TaxID=41062 RepID=A0A5N5WK02_9EURO|nr:hypothetical protein BDV29DRAFT_162829 [Aspergillus leporis]
MSKAFDQILDGAIDLDREISSQVARIEWVLPSPEGLKFYSSMMAFMKGEQVPNTSADTEVCVVVCLAMMKRGRSTGEEFQTENLLIPMKVSCEDVTRRQ